MSSSTLVYRVGGSIAVIGGILLMSADLYGALIFDFEDFSDAVTRSSYTLLQSLYLLGTVLILGGLVALYAHQAGISGSLGFLSFVLAFVGTTLEVGAIWAETFVAPTAAEVAPQFLEAEPSGMLVFGFTMSSVLLALGWTLFGVSIFRARIYPRLIAIFLIVGALLSFVPLASMTVALSAAITLLGLSLFRSGAVSSEAP